MLLFLFIQNTYKKRIFFHYTPPFSLDYLSKVGGFFLCDRCRVYPSIVRHQRLLLVMIGFTVAGAVVCFCPFISSATWHFFSRPVFFLALFRVSHGRRTRGALDESLRERVTQNKHRPRRRHLALM